MRELQEKAEKLRETILSKGVTPEELNELLEVERELTLMEEQA